MVVVVVQKCQNLLGNPMPTENLIRLPVMTESSSSSILFIIAKRCDVTRLGMAARIFCSKNKWQLET